MKLPNFVKQESPTKYNPKSARVLPKEMIETAIAGLDEMLGDTATVKTRIVAD